MSSAATSAAPLPLAAFASALLDVLDRAAANFVGREVVVEVEWLAEHQCGLLAQVFEAVVRRASR